MSNKPLIVGVTGGIGSGKSTVCRIFESLGAVTYYADDRAKWLMNHNTDLITSIKNLFGEKAFVDGALDRTYIARQVFTNKDLLEELNQLVHPAVAKDVKEWKSINQNAPLLLKEAALLFETGSYKELDKTILITADEEIRIRRVVNRDTHRTEADVKDIISKQMSDEEKLLLADFVIHNDEQQSLIKQVMDIYPSFVA